MSLTASFSDKHFWKRIPYLTSRNFAMISQCGCGSLTSFFFYMAQVTILLYQVNCNREKQNMAYLICSKSKFVVGPIPTCCALFILQQAIKIRDLPA